MRRRAAIVAFWLAASLAMAGCQLGCPAALLTGVLVRQGSDLVVGQPDGSAPLERVRWPAGHRVEERDGRLVVVDVFGNIEAGEGDSVRLGGGQGGDGVWGVCGLLEAASPPP